MPVRELHADLRAQAVEAGFGEDLYSPIEEPLVDYGVEETAAADSAEVLEQKKARAIEHVTEGTGWEAFSRVQLAPEMDRVGNTPTHLVGPQNEARMQRALRSRTRSPPRRVPTARSASRPASPSRRRE